MKQPPFSFPPPLPALDTLLEALPAPPAWLQDEGRNRLLLLLNHVLRQEPQAMERLRRQQGKTLRVQWARLHLSLQLTPAGLLALADAAVTPDLRLELLETSPLVLAKTALEGHKPAVDIQGDVQLAAEIAWVSDNLRWDAEEDLARLLGDATAYRMAEGARAVLARVKRFAGPMDSRGGM